MLSQTRNIVFKRPLESIGSQIRGPESVYRRSSIRGFHKSQPKMANTSSTLKQTLTPTLLEDVRSFWFEHIGGEEPLILPQQKDMQRWFARDANFDDACV